LNESDNGINEQALVEFEQYIKDIWSFLPTPITYLSPLGVILDLDKTLEDMLHCTKEEVVGKFLSEFAMEKEKIEKLQDLTLKEGSVRNYVCTIKSNNERLIPVSISTLIRRSYEGEIIGYFAALTDITESKETSEFLQKTAKYQRQLLETARYLTESLDVKEVLARIGSSARDILKAHGCAIYLLETDRKTLTPVVAIDPPYEQEILATPIDIDKSFTGYAIKEGKAMVFNETHENTRGFHIPGTPDEKDERIIVAPFIVDGEKLGAMCLNRYGKNFGDDDLSVAEVFATYAATALRNARTHNDLQQEIQQRKYVQDALESEKAHLEQLFESALEGIAVTDVDGKVQRINEEFTTIFGYSRDEVAGKSIDRLIAPPDMVDDARALTERAGRGERVALETVRCRKDGSLIDVSVLAAPIIVNQKLVSVYAIYRDITARKKADRKLRESEERYRTLVNTTPEAVTVTDLEGRITYVSQQTLKLHGYAKPEELYGKSAFDMIDPKDHKRAMANLKKTLEHGVTRNLEYTLLRKDGSSFDGELNASLIKDEKGNPQAFVATTRDITERKSAEKALRDNEEKYRNLFQSSNDAIFLHDLSGGIIDVNSGVMDLFGYGKEEILKLTIDKLHPSYELSRSARAFKDIEKNGTVDFEINFKKKDDSVFPAEVSSSLFEIGGCKVIQGVVRDISERRETEQNLRESEERYRELVEKAGAAILIDDREGNFVYCNKRLADLFGYPLEEMQTKSIQSIVHPADIQRVLKMHYGRIQGKKVPSKYEFMGIKKSGDLMYLEIDAIALKEGKDIVGTRSYIWDITQRKKTEEAIRSSEERLKVLFEFAPDGYYLMDLKGNFLDGNKAAEDMTGYKKEELIGKNFAKAKLLSANQLPKALTLLARNAMGQPTGPDEFTLARKDGSKTIVGIRTFPVRIEGDTVVLGIARDITEYKRTQDELKYSYERMQKVLEDTINALTSAVEKRDPYTAGHQHRVAVLADAIAEKMRLPSIQKLGLHVAALVHDIGKINVPAGILNKPSGLSDAEFALVKDHVLVGYDILRTIEFPWPVAEIVLQHHERLDGSGYPKGLKGSEMLPEAKILAVADVVESMLAHRPYRPARGMESAVKEITKHKKKLYDAKAVSACLKVLKNKDFSLEF
jgi:PAS domain S-box-containing protein/putative nucleotidyltransferase with HDIG domain